MTKEYLRGEVIKSKFDEWKRKGRRKERPNQTYWQEDEEEDGRHAQRVESSEKAGRLVIKHQGQWHRDEQIRQC